MLDDLLYRVRQQLDAQVLAQRHRVIDRAAAVAQTLKVRDQRVVRLDLRALGGSALTADIPVPKQRTEAEMSVGIPLTYVPARNTILLGLALGYAETVGAFDLFIGANILDYSGYPDCRPEYYEAFNRLIAVGTKPATQIEIVTPVITLRKSAIIQRGQELNAPLHLTWSCYEAEDLACGSCDSCALRLRGFAEAGIVDPIAYSTLAI